MGCSDHAASGNHLDGSHLGHSAGADHFRAEETRTVADQMTHEEARTIMRRIANDYDRLTKVAEEQLADQERGDKT